MHNELCMVLQVVFVISHGQDSVEIGFSLNKNILGLKNLKFCFLFCYFLLSMVY